MRFRAATALFKISMANSAVSPIASAIMTEIAIGIEIATETEIRTAIETATKTEITTATETGIMMATANMRRAGLIRSHAVKSMRKGIRCGQFARA
jgi:hypothetical protein